MNSVMVFPWVCGVLLVLYASREGFDNFERRFSMIHLAVAAMMVGENAKMALIQSDSNAMYASMPPLAERLMPATESKNLSFVELCGLDLSPSASH